MHISKVLVTCFGIGLTPKAPGTWGSLPGLLLGWGIHTLSATVGWSPGLNLFLLLFGSLLVWRCIEWYEAVHSVHDEGSTVIDEVIGMAIGVGFCEPNFLNYVLAFCVFRFLDIRKPGMIGWADRSLKGGWGTLADDLIAGCVTSAIIALLELASR